MNNDNIDSSGEMINNVDAEDTLPFCRGITTKIIEVSDEDFRIFRK